MTPYKTKKKIFLNEICYWSQSVCKDFGRHSRSW